MEHITTRLMADTQRARELVARHPGLSITFSDSCDGGLGLYEARHRGHLVDVDAKLGVLLDLLEALEATERAAVRGTSADRPPGPGPE